MNRLQAMAATSTPSNPRPSFEGGSVGTGTRLIAWCASRVAGSCVLASTACGPERGGAECEPGALEVVEVRTPADVAALARVEVMAELHIVDSELVDLSGFECLRQAEKVYIERNPLLESLDGLDGLTEIVGRLDDPEDDAGAELLIRGNDSLVDVSGLSGLQRVEGTLELSGNSVLAEVAGLSALELVGRDFVVSENDRLERLGGLDAFGGGTHYGEGAGGFVRISDNPVLREVVFPQHPIKAAGVEIERNPQLVDLSARLLCSPFWYAITDCPLLQDLPQSVRESTPIPSLLCADRTEAYSVVGIPAISDLTALPRVQSLARLEIGANAGLAGLGGLEELQYVAELVIEDNPKLASIAKLDVVMQGGLLTVESLLAVRNNQMLDQCEVNDFAELLLAQNDELTLDIGGNGGGCQ